MMFSAFSGQFLVASGEGMEYVRSHSLSEMNRVHQIAPMFCGQPWFVQRDTLLRRAG